ncbi:MAG: 2-C-methyl-D-erythritol 4-phosphate cytidylyltransferase [Bacteroidota bacterium]|nr:2-C-methyl-D-erythritol 4-phosphate cytidylyltransferase [Bacteroidota bacterium]
MNQNYVIIVAGGSGKRMDAGIPKQFLLLNGRPILMHTCETFYRFSKSLIQILVLPVEYISTWEELCKTYSFAIPHRVVEGGPERFFSVQNALRSIAIGEGLVAIHDGVRPLVSHKTIQAAFDAAQQFGNAIPVIPVIESVREQTATGNRIIDRNKLHLIQTPQVFQCKLICKAYEQEFSTSFTDDASVLEKMGGKIVLTEGNPENIKITRPMDLVIAEALMKRA